MIKYIYCEDSKENKFVFMQPFMISMQNFQPRFILITFNVIEQKVGFLINLLY